MSDALLPCPFCGGEGQLIVDLVQCAKCAAVGPFTRRELHGIAQPGESWNARTPAVSPDALLSEEEREALECAADDCEWRNGYGRKLRSLIELEKAGRVLRALLRRASGGT